MTNEMIGSYRIVAQVGFGAFGVVYEGHQPFLDRRVAIKMLRDVTMSDTKLESALMGEARTIARLRHPNIVTVYEFGTSAAQQRSMAYMAMEFLPGQTLHERMKGGQLPLADALDILEQVAAGLDYAHQRGVVHRDLKPANIMFTDSGQAVIVDFGLAKLVELAAAGAGVSDSAAPNESTVSGTPDYMSPEQLLGEKASAASDRYALATIAYQLLSGHLPFEEPGNPNAFLDRLHRLPTPLSTHEIGFDKRIDPIFERALASNPTVRYPTAAAFLSALTDLIAPDRRRQRVVTVVDPAQAEALRMSRQTVRGFMWGLVALTVVVTILLWAGFYRGFIEATPSFITDGLEIRTRLEGEQNRFITGVWPGGPADRAGLKVGDQLVAHLEDDRRNANLPYTINGVERAVYGENWQPQLGDIIGRPVLRDGQTLDLPVTLDRNTQLIYEGLSLAVPALLAIGCAVWVLRRWGDEPNGQFYAGLMLVQGLAMAATGTLHINIDLAQIFYMAFFAMTIDFILRFPVPARRVYQRRWVLWLLYVPILVPVFSYLTGITPMIGAWHVGFTLFFVYIAMLIVLQTLKWLRTDTRTYKGVWWLLVGNYFMGAGGALATYLGIATEFPEPPLGNASFAQVVLFAVLAVTGTVFVLVQTVGFHRTQSQLGASLLTSITSTDSRRTSHTLSVGQ
jgi:tRNA A-37 threonylcarbamoyl transferase component Bud32/bacteriorhodopsin